MDNKVRKRLELELEKAVTNVIVRLNLRHLPLLPSQQTMRRMAQAAVSVYESAVELRDSPELDTKQRGGEPGIP